MKLKIDMLYAFQTNIKGKDVTDFNKGGLILRNGVDDHLNE